MSQPPGISYASAASAKFAAFTSRKLAYWTDFASHFERWERSRKGYQTRLQEIYSFLIPPGMRVLEIGCARGDLLAALKPAHGVGVDFCPAMIERARQRNPQFEFVEADAHDFDLGQTFDYIVCSDLINDLWDVQKVFENVARHCHPNTRVILNATAGCGSCRGAWRNRWAWSSARPCRTGWLPATWLTCCTWRIWN